MMICSECKNVSEVLFGYYGRDLCLPCKREIEKLFKEAYEKCTVTDISEAKDYTGYK